MGQGKGHPNAQATFAPGQISSQLTMDLEKTGLLVPDNTAGDEALKISHDDLLLFLPLLTLFDVRLVPMASGNCPVRFCTGILKPLGNQSPSSEYGPGPIPAGGQGRTSVSAALGCLGELAERLSLCNLGRSDPRIGVKEAVQLEVGLNRLLGLSDAQTDGIQRSLGWAPPRTDCGEIDWEGLSPRRLSVSRLGDGKRAQVPSIGVLFHEFEQVAGVELSFASSSGCAVWHSLEGARERALLELLERDSVSQAWYNRLGISLLPSEVWSGCIPGSLADYLLERSRSTRLYRVATDFGVQVVLAVSFDEDGKYSALGSSAGWDIASACESAVQEMLQGENSLSLMQKAFPEHIGTGQEKSALPRQLLYAQQQSIFDDLPLNDVETASEVDLARSFSFEIALRTCLDQKIEIWEFDATRPDLMVPCVKLLSPDLCSCEPRFGKKRLYEGVVARGQRKEKAKESEFSSRIFPF